MYEANYPELLGTVIIINGTHLDKIKTLKRNDLKILPIS